MMILMRYLFSSDLQNLLFGLSCLLVQEFYGTKMFSAARRSFFLICIKQEIAINNAYKLVRGLLIVFLILHAKVELNTYKGYRLNLLLQ